LGLNMMRTLNIFAGLVVLLVICINVSYEQSFIPAERFNFFSNVPDFIAVGKQGAILATNEIQTGDFPISLLVSQTRHVWYENFTNAEFICNLTGCFSRFVGQSPTACFQIPGLNYFSQGQFWSSLFYVANTIGSPFARTSTELPTLESISVMSRSISSIYDDDCNDEITCRNWINFNPVGVKKLYTALSRDIGQCCTDQGTTVWADPVTGIQEFVAYGVEIPSFVTPGTSTFDTFLSGYIKFFKYTPHVRNSDIPTFHCDTLGDACFTQFGSLGYCNTTSGTRYPYFVQ